MHEGEKLKRGPKSSNGSNSVMSSILLDRNLKLHLMVAALATDQDQSEIIRNALEERLTAMGCDLTKPPLLPNLKRLPKS